MPSTDCKSVFCICLLAVTFVCAETCLAVERGGVLIRTPTVESHERALTANLRKITGWNDLEFDSCGALQPGNTQPATGSTLARDLLTTAASGSAVIVIEDASDRVDLAFARVTQGRWLRPATYAGPAYVVQIDFSDFEKVFGDQRALDAFNVGWALLHEIDHIVNDSRDAISQTQTGACEDHINGMRRELGLPERAEYFHRMLPISDSSRQFKTVFVRLRFESRLGSKKKRYWLLWDAVEVGGLNESKVLATLR